VQKERRGHILYRTGVRMFRREYHVAAPEGATL
jgi:hypothetical protein